MLQKLLLSSSAIFLSIASLLAQVPADLCENAENITCGSIITGTTIDNTSSGANPAPDEFYSYTGEGMAGMITISLCSDVTDYDSFLRIYDSCDLTTAIAQNDDFCDLQSEVSFSSDGTTTYIIMVEGFNNNAGSYELEITCNIFNGTNDNCIDATPMSCGETLLGDTSDDTDTGENESADEFFIFTGDGFEQDVTVSLCSDVTNFDSFLRIFSDCTFNNQIAANDDACDLQSEVTFTSDGVSSYIIMVEGFGANTGQFEIAVTCSGPPMPPPNDQIENSILIENVFQPFTDPDVNLPDATPEVGNPTNCSLTGFSGVWYHFNLDGANYIEGNIETPGGVSSFIYFSAPSDNATVDQLTRIEHPNNPCFTGTSASIVDESESTIYMFVSNNGARSNINTNAAIIGVDDFIAPVVSVFPNPASEILNIKSTAQIDEAVIYSLLGQQIKKAETANDTLSINISALKQGSYIIRITSNGATSNYTFIKQ